jgi:hypothetical protein
MMTPDCARAHEIWRDELRGAVPSEEARAFIAAHLGACEECRLEARAIETAAVGDSSSPAPVLDDLARRRWVDGALERHRAVRRAPDRADRRGSTAGRGAWFWGGAAAAVAAAALAVSVGLGVGDHPARAPKAAGPLATGVVETARQVRAELLMVSGGPSLGGISVGDDVAASDEVVTGDRSAVLDLCGQGRILLRAGTALRIAAMDERRVELELSAGSVLAAWDPKEPGIRLVVATPRGRAVVKGTVFAVDAERARVDVVRGAIEFEIPGAAPMHVAHGRFAEADAWGTSQIEPRDGGRFDGELRAMRLLDTKTRVVIEVVSEPGGAMVSVDGVPLGPSPLTASAPAGIVELSASVPGLEAAVERVVAKAGERVFYRFVLRAPRREDAGKVTVAPTAEELLRRAQEHRLRGEWTLAAEALMALIRRYPEREEASSSLVSLSLVELDHLGRPSDALGHLDRYLVASGHGALAQEAAFARIRALRGLGRRAAERDAISEFLARFPKAIQASGLEERLRELPQ